MIRTAPDPSETEGPATDAERLRAALERAAHLLPDQGPIAVFVHHNTLHAFEGLGFHDAVAEGAAVYGARAYLDEETFRALHAAGRIDDADLDAALDACGHADAPLGACFGRARALQRAALLAVTPAPPEPVLRWLLDEDPSMTPHRALWRAAVDAVGGGPEATAPLAARVDLVARDPDERAVDELVDPLLVRLCAAFLDQGVAPWTMPGRDEGMYRAWVGLMAVRPAAPRPHWLAGLDAQLPALAGRTAEEAALAALRDGGGPPARWDERVAAALLALPGWAGMFSRLERHPHERAPGAPPARLVDLLAVRLVLADHARRSLARAPRGLRPVAPAAGSVARAWRLCAVARRLGLAPDALRGWSRADAEGFAGLDAFDDLARLRVWQEAYEGHYRAQLVAALAHGLPPAVAPVAAPRFQGIFCFDDREESLRRHFEELDPRHETFGAPGFFGVAMAFRGVSQSDFAPLCPVVVTPAHQVEALPVAPAEAERFRRGRRLRGLVLRAAHGSSRGLVRGVVGLPLLGVASALLLPLGLLAPRFADRLDRALRARLAPPPATRLSAHRDEGDEGARGFTLAEQVQRVAATLENIGLTRGFAPIVFVLGHGSTSANNPHRSAYDCGACGGRRGGPSARLFAELANRPGVRAGLAARGIEVPATTWFVGGEHDTTTDAITLADLDAVPAALRPELEALRARLDEARARQARERCRRFASAPSRPDGAAALRHVEARAASIAQPRPELGHATLAAAVVGRRALTRGLFLDRRALLISYDPTQDPDGAIVERVLAGAAPVGAGINLEYYFSRVDNARYGCGTKLPHNPVALLGVMEGSSGDLRTGLPQQMIEIHEPMRLQLFVEATPATRRPRAAWRPEVRALVAGEWVRLVSVDPLTGAMQLFADGAFVPVDPPAAPLPEATDSLAWCAGRDGPLPPARIVGAPRRAA